MSEIVKVFIRGEMKGKELAKMRRLLWMTQKQMYTKLGIPRRTYEDYEYDKRSIPAGVQRLVTIMFGNRNKNR